METDTFQVGDKVCLCNTVNAFFVHDGEFKLFTGQPGLYGVISRYTQSDNNFVFEVTVKAADLEWEDSKPDCENVNIVCWGSELLKVQ